MSIFYANHAKMNVLLQPFTPSYPVSRSSGSTPGRSSGSPASSSSSASSPRHHPDTAYRRPTSDYADSPDYAKRRREASPELRTASMSPRPDRRRHRADNDMAMQPRAAYADPPGSGSGSGSGGGRARAASPETMARCARLGARLNRPLLLTPTSSSRSRGQAMQSTEHGRPMIIIDPASFHSHQASSSLPSNPFTPTSRLSRSPTPSPPSRRRDSDHSEMARAGTRPGDDGGSRYRSETVGSRHSGHDNYDRDRGPYIKSERDLGRASPPSESGGSSSSSSGGSRRRSSSTSSDGDSEDSRSKYRSIRDYAVARPRPLSAARTATLRDERDGRFGLDGRERFALYGTQRPTAAMSTPRSAAATESRAFWLNVGECELRFGDRRVRRDDENQSSSQRTGTAGSERRRSLSLRMGKHVLQYDG